VPIPIAATARASAPTSFFVPKLDIFSPPENNSRNNYAIKISLNNNKLQYKIENLQISNASLSYSP
jgi:hypothetical protein